MQKEQENTSSDSDLIVDVSSNELASDRWKGGGNDGNDVNNPNNNTADS